MQSLADTPHVMNGDLKGVILVDEIATLGDISGCGLWDNGDRLPFYALRDRQDGAWDFFISYGFENEDMRVDQSVDQAIRGLLYKTYGR